MRNTLTILLLTLACGIEAIAAPQLFRHVKSKAELEKERAVNRRAEESRTAAKSLARSQSAAVFDTEAALEAAAVDSLWTRIEAARQTPDYNFDYLSSPWVFRGYRQLTHKDFKPTFTLTTGEVISAPRYEYADEGTPLSDFQKEEPADSASTLVSRPAYYVDLMHYSTPEWLRSALTSRRIQEDAKHSVMVTHPSTIDYTFWDLPEPVRLPEDDRSFAAYIRQLDLPEIDTSKAVLGEREQMRRHWLHTLNIGLHFSQAYISPNWYQGGNNYLSLLGNFLWNVELNQVYHPNLMFVNTVSYKLGLNSTPQDKCHKYSISEDIFQWNVKAGLKAFRKWFYSYNLQFKTQLLNNYPQDSWTRSASFLSPGDLNMGLGMTYSTTNRRKTLQFNASISPISYNLKTCIDPEVEPTQFNVPTGRKTHSEIGSNAELTLLWNWASNISYKSRLFLFTDYKYFMGDWENTVTFNINRFLSTQIYVHLRYDSSSDISSGKWHHWMLKEILSFGFTYAFSTKV